MKFKAVSSVTIGYLYTTRPENWEVDTLYENQVIYNKVDNSLYVFYRAKMTKIGSYGYNNQLYLKLPDNFPRSGQDKLYVLYWFGVDGLGIGEYRIAGGKLEVARASVSTIDRNRVTTPQQFSNKTNQEIMIQGFIKL